MPIQRKYDFQPGMRISSDQVDEEFNQLIAQVNQIESDDNEKDTALRTIAQLSKITNDIGGAKLNITDSTKDLLAELLKLGPGLHTFYAIDGTSNLPNGKSTRGIFHNTGNNIGWILAFDYTNTLYYNYLSSGVWVGWNTKPFLDVSKTDAAVIAVNTWTKIIPNILTSNVGGGGWGAGTYTVPSSGVYQIYMSVSLASMIAGHSIYTAAYVNGSLFDKTRIAQKQMSGENDGIVIGSTTLHLSAGDKLDFWVYQNSAGAKNLNYSYMRVVKIT